MFRPVLSWLFVVGITLQAGAALAATRVVNSTLDTNDGFCSTTAGGCTFREAVAGAAAGDRIVFAFSPALLSPPTITLTSALPELNDAAVEIDGFDCTGCGSVGENTNDPLDGLNTAIGPTLNGNNLFLPFAILRITGDDVVVRGLNLQNSPGAGIYVDADGVVLEGNYVGTNRAGTAGAGSDGPGIWIDGGDGQVVGPGNLIAANSGDGIYIDGYTVDDVQIVGNLIGTDVTGMVDLGNTGDGIELQGPTQSGQVMNDIAVGGLDASDFNLVSGNGGWGLRLLDRVNAAVVQGNRIGVRADEGAAMPNTSGGLIMLGTFGNQVREVDVVDNVIAGNQGPGLHAEAARTGTVLRNWIGTDMTGTLALGNGGEGVYLLGQSGEATYGFTVGSADPADANTIAWNVGDGIRIRANGLGSYNHGVLVNSVHDNGGLGIDLEGAATGNGPASPGPTSCTDDAAFGNGAWGRPVLDSAWLGLDGTLTLAGSACPLAVLGAFVADGDTSGYGEPETYLPASGSADGAGLFTLAVPAAAVVVGDPITVLSLDPVDVETGEASAWVLVSSCDGDGDGVERAECGGLDCDDSDDTRFPGAAEACNGVDDACAGSVPANEADADLDGARPCSGDCADSDANVNPSAPELCDGIDQDCDLGVDEGFLDTDGDGAADCVDADDDGDLDPDVSDCAALDPDVGAGITELCDGLDQDCDLAVDEGFLDTDGDSAADCVDTDDDGDGDPDVSDCAPTDEDIGAGAAELCDGIDQDCDGTADDGFANLDGDLLADCVDGDDDGDGVGDAGDCAPLDASVAPGLPELCDGLDQDCDGVADDGLTDTDLDGTADCADSDDDADGTPDPMDCGPLDPAISSSATELCDGIDNNCEGVADEGFSDLDGDLAADCVDLDDDGDLDPDATDCAAADAGIHSGAAELCDGLDQDCDGAVDDGFADTDGDGEADCVDEDDDQDGADDAADCAPLDPTVAPGLAELCDGVDQDCDGQVDEDIPDTDGDTILDCLDDDDDGDGTADAADCEPLDSTISPSMPESCDGLDQNCDGFVDEGFGDTDLDGDADCVDADDDEDGAADVMDCAPLDATIAPGAVEVCGDGVDQDCDGMDGAATDADTDGWTPCEGDCDDGDAAIAPGATEGCDGVDQDCDGTADEGLDQDGDGVTPCGPDGTPGNDDDDCDDGSAAIGPDATEVCDDGVDSDCDGLDGDLSDNDGDLVPACGGDCDDDDASIGPGAVESCDGVDEDCDGVVDNGFDSDGDGHSPCAGDCDDADASRFPGAFEDCSNGVDEDCDGVVDEDDDTDGDGFGTCGGDCDDGDAATFPGAEELCNGADDDCDGLLGTAESTDADGDGVPLCEDCDDADSTAAPGLPELCGDGVDNDCDGSTDVADVDGDGADALECGGTDCDDGDPAVHPGATELCGDGVDQDCVDGDLGGDLDGDGYDQIPCGGDDCDDSDALRHPGATELCLDGTDSDCDGEDGAGDADGDGSASEDCGGDDCDDADPTRSPASEELCGDGVDQDCDGVEPACDAADPLFVGGGCHCDAGGPDRSPSAPWALAALVVVFQSRRRRGLRRACRA